MVELELEAPGFKVVSDWEVGPLVRSVVEGFKVVSATVTDKAIGTVVSGVNVVETVWLAVVIEASGFKVVVSDCFNVVVASDCWILLLAVVAEMDKVVESEVETLTELWVDEDSVEAFTDVELGFEVLSVEDATVGSIDKLVVCGKDILVVSEDKDDSIVAVTGLVVSDWDSVETGEFGDMVMGCWVVNRVDIVGSKVELELTGVSVVEETPSVTVVGFKDVWDWLTKDTVDAGIEAGVLGFRDVLGDFVDKKCGNVSVVVSIGMSDVLGAVVGFKDVWDSLTKESVDAGMEAGVLGFRDVLGDFVDKKCGNVSVVVSVGMSDVESGEKVVSVTEEESVTIEDTEGELDSVVDLAKGVVSRGSGPSNGDSVPEPRVGSFVRSVTGSVELVMGLGKVVSEDWAVVAPGAAVVSPGTDVRSEL